MVRFATVNKLLIDPPHHIVPMVSDNVLKYLKIFVRRVSVHHKAENKKTNIMFL